MKTTVLFPFLVLSLLIPFAGQAQDNYNASPFHPFKSGVSPLFGKDIVIYNDQSANQTNIDICSAYNGWLFVAISSLTSQGLRMMILMSTDNGMTWTVKMNSLSSFINTIIRRVTITTSGNSTDNLKLYLGLIHVDTAYAWSSAWVGRYHVEPFMGEEEILTDYDESNDIFLSSDYIFPATGSSPGSIAVLYSKTGTKDSVICRTSSNGGIALNNRKVVAVTTNHFDRVALNYGISNSWSTGRYYAAWEEKENGYSDVGHIYTAHSEPNFNSPFTDPVCLDSLNDSWINQCRNPVMACQYGETDNDSANITELIVFETLNAINNSFDVVGCYNLQSTLSSEFISCSLAASPDAEMQPDINFNPADDSFMVTCLNQTTQMLPFLTNGVNLQNPNQWTVVSDGYNDNPTGTDSNPKVTFSPDEASGANVWISELPGGNGIGLFDAVYSTYTGNRERFLKQDFPNLIVYPNPCTSTITVGFELAEEAYIDLALSDLLGQIVMNFPRNVFPGGIQRQTIDISSLPAGIYFIHYSCDGYQACKKINIIR